MNHGNFDKHCTRIQLSLPGGSDGKESACNTEDSVLIPGSGRSPGIGNGNPFQYFCLENPMDRGAWWAAVHEATESDMAELLTHIHKDTIMQLFLLYYNIIFELVFKSMEI